MGIAEVLGLAAGEVDNERPRFFGDDGLAARTRTVVERRHGAQSFRTPHAALDRLMRPNRPPHCVKRRGSFGRRAARIAPTRISKTAPSSAVFSAGASNITAAKLGASDLSIARPRADRRHPNSCCEVIP